MTELNLSAEIAMFVLIGACLAVAALLNWLMSKCVFGHKWMVWYEQETCPVEYRTCLRCRRVRHACAEIDWSHPNRSNR